MASKAARPDSGCPSIVVTAESTLSWREVCVLLLIAVLLVTEYTKPSLEWRPPTHPTHANEHEFPVRDRKGAGVTERVAAATGERSSSSRVVRQAPNQDPQCAPFPSGEALRRSFEQLGVTNGGLCADFSTTATQLQATRDLCYLAATVGLHLEKVEDQLSSNDTELENATALAADSLGSLASFTSATCPQLDNASVAGLPANVSALTAMAELLDSALALLQPATAGQLADEQDALEQRTTGMRGTLSDLANVMIYENAAATLPTFDDLPPLPVCEVAYPACQAGAGNNASAVAVSSYGVASTACERPRLIQTLFYARTHPEAPRLIDFLVLLLWHDQCVNDATTRLAGDCFAIADDDGGECAGLPVYSCPAPFQTTDDASHWLPAFRSQDELLSVFVANHARDFAPCSFPCGQRCRAEGYTSGEASALLAVQSVSVFVALLLTLVALVMAAVNRKVMLRYPNRLFVYLNGAFLLFVASYLPAASVDVIPLLCHSDRTLRTANFTDSALCTYSFVLNYGGGILLQTVAVFIAVSWLRLAQSFRKVSLSHRNDRHELALEAGVLLLGVALAGVGVGVLLSRGDDGVDMVVQNGICTVSSKHSFAALEMPLAASSGVQGLALLVGLLQLWRVRRTSRETRRSASAIGGGSGTRADATLSRIIRTLFLYVLVTALSGAAWILAVVALRVGGVDPTELFDDFVVFVCTLVTCGDEKRCAVARVPAYSVASDFFFAALLGVSGVIYSSWIFQRSIWKSVKITRRVSSLSNVFSILGSRLSLASGRLSTSQLSPAGEPNRKSTTTLESTSDFTVLSVSPRDAADGGIELVSPLERTVSSASHVPLVRMARGSSLLEGVFCATAPSSPVIVATGTPPPTLSLSNGSTPRETTLGNSTPA